METALPAAFFLLEKNNGKSAWSGEKRKQKKKKKNYLFIKNFVTSSPISLNKVKYCLSLRGTSILAMSSNLQKTERIEVSNEWQKEKGKREKQTYLSLMLVAVML